MYTNGKNLGEITTRLNNLGLKPKEGKTWSKSSLHHIITNVTYIGKIKYTDKKYLKKRNDYGELVRVINPNPEIYIVDGLHEPIINEETFYTAQNIYKNHQLADTRTKADLSLKNPLSGLLKCKICGSTLKRKNSKHNYIGVVCKQNHIASSRLELVEKKVLKSLNEILENYKLDLTSNSNDLELETTLKNTDIQIKSLEETLKKLSSQKEKLYDLLEQGIYTQETFFERSKTLASKIADIKNKINEVEKMKQDFITLKERKQNIIPHIEKVIETYPYSTVEQKNKLLKSCIKKVEYYKEKGNNTPDDFEITLFPIL